MIRQRLPQKETLDKAQPRDNFLTPNYATELLGPFIPKNVHMIWECAAGTGKIAKVLREHNYHVLATDINGNFGKSVNFLTDKPDIGWEPDCIITNPPYSIKRKWFIKCIEYDLPFALLISGDYSLWTIDAIRKYNCEKIIPDHRIDYITPTGLDGSSGHTSYFHSYWLTRFFGLGRTETFVELTKSMKENI
jgi:hypothetical protein